MTHKGILDQAANFVFSQLDEVDNNLDAMAHPLRIFLFIYLAQAAIEVGGLEYFFSSEFPENPPYSQFLSAYREIGAIDAADLIEKSLAFFDFESPETQLNLRQDFIQSLPDDQTHPFSKLSTRVCEDETIWEYLEHYVANNKDAFRLP